MLNLNQAILLAYPDTIDCVDSHIGPTVWGWHWELEDDHYSLMKVQRCSHCGMPNGSDEYADREEIEAYFRGEEPKQ